jgi:hypothetical protein
MIETSELKNCHSLMGFFLIKKKYLKIKHRNVFTKHLIESVLLLFFSIN